jgi:hypothetical protein
MSVTKLAEVEQQIQTKWSTLFPKELRSSKPLIEVVNKDYQGEIQEQYNTVKVSMLRKVKGQIKNIASGEGDTFDTEKLKLESVAVVADRRLVAATEITDLAELQSQLANPTMQSSIREALLEGVASQWNDYLYSLVNPSTSNPDHLITGKSALVATDLQAFRVLAGQAKWRKDKPWYGLLDPVYYGDLLGQTTMTSKDFIEGEAPVVAGEIVNKRYGFGLLEDNSRIDKKGLFMHPDFLISVIQRNARFKISDLHGQKKFGYVLSVDIVAGAKLNIEGPLQHIWVTSGSALDAATSSSDN